MWNIMYLFKAFHSNLNENVTEILKHLTNAEENKTRGKCLMLLGNVSGCHRDSCSTTPIPSAIPLKNTTVCKQRDISLVFLSFLSLSAIMSDTIYPPESIYNLIPREEEKAGKAPR